MSTRNLLVELFVEELPPKALKKLGESFSGVLAESLKAAGLVADDSTVTTFASPRRLAAHITNVSAKAADKQVAQKLMPATVGLNASGNATPALLKKLQALGEDESAVSKLRKENDGKADILFLDATQAGATLQEGLQKALDETLAKLPIPKVMTYQINDGWQSVNFVRPAHGLVALHGGEIVPVSTLGLTAGNTTQGHRFEAKNPVVTISNADTYAQQLLEEGAVIAGFDARRAEIVKQLQAAADKQGLKPIEDEALLDEVTALVERPNVLLGQFEEEFLAVPQECLILTMKANQKYFPLLDGSGKLTNKFLIVSNINPADASKVIGGNERVVRPRLADAKFFFDQDRKKTLESRLAGLGKVVYHNKLGSQGERNERVVAIASAIAQQIGGDGFVTKVAQAARLSKVDLLTDMVGEFPELQGIMGRYYAQHEGLADDVAYAIEDHYRPRFAGDELPRSQVGVVVALADKLETLVGLFSIGEKPTGDKDPFALRRQALGIIRMLIECESTIKLNELLGIASTIFPSLDAATLINIEEFILERLSGYFRDQAFSALEIEAVLSLRPQLLSDIKRRLEATQAFAKFPEAESLIAANKRIGNILKKSVDIQKKYDVNKLTEPAESLLISQLSQIMPIVEKSYQSGDYAASLIPLATLKNPVDKFFEDVMVNVDDVDLRASRLGLLEQLHQTMNRVADLSKLAS
jgi:glycyl-tRNA synthetase beta chain